MVAPAASALAIRSAGSADIGTLVPIEAEPAQVPQNRLSRAGLKPRMVQIVNPQQERPTLKAAMQPGQKRCAQIAQVERTAGCGCKTSPNQLNQAPSCTRSLNILPGVKAGTRLAGI